MAHAGTHALWVSWTAGGDDGTIGRATQYELRYSTEPLPPSTQTWWDRAQAVHNLPSPSPDGATDSVHVTGLDPGTRYYFVIRSRDDAGQASPFSGAASGATDTIATSTATQIQLGAVTPNPTPGAMSVPFTLPDETQVDLEIVDARGRRVAVLAHGVYEPGWYPAVWDGLIAGVPAPPGMYFVKMHAAGTEWFRKVAVVR